MDRGIPDVPKCPQMSPISRFWKGDTGDIPQTAVVSGPKNRLP
jgi:hypothetical protein